jgi:hypothetical protein
VTPFTKDSAVVRTKRTWLLVLGFTLTTVGLVPAIVALLFALLAQDLVVLLGVAAYVAAALAPTWLWSRQWRARRGQLRADEVGVFVDHRLVIARKKIPYGHVLEREGVRVVRLGRTFRPVEIEVADEAEADALLRALRLDAERAAAQYTFAYGTWRGAWIRAAKGLVLSLVGLGAAAFFSLASPVLFFAVLLFVLAAVVHWTLGEIVRVVVGTDGIRIRRLSSRWRFVPFSQLRAAETDGRDVVITLENGKVFRFHSPGGKGWRPLAFADRGEEGVKVVERITEGIARQTHAHSSGSALARGSRTTREWLRALSVSSDQRASFRAPAIPPDELWRVVADPTMATTARAGAAAALQSTLDDEGRTRMRVLADACASPKLRVALETTASAKDESELERVFDELEDDHRAALDPRRHAP